MNKIFITYFFFSCFTFTHGLIAQGLVYGRVVDAQTRQVIPGVNIVVQGSSQGTITDQDGKFTLSTNETALTLKVSAVGYQTMNILASTGEEMTLRMHTDLQQLDEVIISAFEGERKLLETPATMEYDGKLQPFDTLDALLLGLQHTVFMDKNTINLQH